MKRRRYSLAEQAKGLGKLLKFEKDLFITDPKASTLTKTDLKYNEDFLILRGNFAGRIARYVGREAVKRYGSFKSCRNNELRVRCDQDGFGCVPRISCWDDLISNKEQDLKRSPIIVFKAKSVVGDIPIDMMHFAIRDNRNLIGQFTLKKDIIPEVINLKYIEKVLVKLGSHKSAHKKLKMLNKYGFYCVYEDDGWLMKANLDTRIRFMRRSHLFSIIICHSGREVMDSIFDDYTLRSLIPVRLFTGLPGKKKKQKPGHYRRSSSMNEINDLDINDLMDEFDKTESYARIFRREGAVDGNLLCLDTPYLDCVRSFIEHGGFAKDCIVPNIVKYRRMIKYAGGGDEPYLLMTECRIVNGQWNEFVRNVLPNNCFKKYSFSMIYYDGTTKVSSPKISHKIIHETKPKKDIEIVFEKKLFMNNGYLIVALSTRDIQDNKIPFVFDNVNNFVKKISFKNGYIARKLSMGVHQNKMIYLDFQIFVRTKMNAKQRKAFIKKQKIKDGEYKTEDEDESTEDEEEEFDDDDEDNNDDEKEEKDNDSDEKENDDDDDDDDGDYDFFGNLDGKIIDDEYDD